MGLFDSVMAGCANCGKPIEYQSKADVDPYMKVYSVDDAPSHILRDVLNDPQYCRHCGSWTVLYDPDFPPNPPPPPRPNPQARLCREPKDVRIHSTQTFLRWWDSPFSESDIVADAPQGAAQQREG